MQQDRRPRGYSGTGGRSSPYVRPGTGTDAGERWQHDMYDAHERGARHRGQRGASGERLGIRGMAAAAEHDAPSAKLLVQGLHYEVTQEELESLFGRIGATVKCYIRYDRSGRSTGLATVIYKDLRHAIEARQEYDGANAKGQPIKITFEPLREAGAGAQRQGGDLLSRLGGGGGESLSSRIGGGQKGRPPGHAPTGPANKSSQSLRGTHSNRRAARGDRRQRAPAPTADSLDAELEAFMKKPTSSAMAASEHAPQNADKDVDMQ